MYANFQHKADTISAHGTFRHKTLTPARRKPVLTNHVRRIYKD